MAEKKLSGIKIHIAVDTNGLPHAICVTTANVSDRDGAIKMFSQSASNLSNVQKALFDGGYTGEPFEIAVKSILGEDVIAIPFDIGALTAQKIR